MADLKEFAEQLVNLTVKEVNEIAKEKGYVQEGDLIINLVSMPLADRGKVNTLRVSRA